jgi:hypothetical protein
MRRKSRVDRILTLRKLLFVFSAAWLALPGSNMQAQTTATSPAPPSVTAPQSSGAIHGTVTAPNGNVIVGAQVTLVSKPSNLQQTSLTDGEGSFHFTALAAGTFQITVTANGFAPWVGEIFNLSANQQYQVPEISLQIASASTTVHAVFSGYDLAEQQMHIEEKQRVLGVFPNFYTSYVWKAEPLTSGQKFRLAWRSAIDPVTFLSTGAVAGIQQWDNDFSAYGSGVEGYSKRYGANYADGFIGLMLGGAVFPSILHQDPRYFYKGTGSIRSRALYALSTVVVARGDNGRWQPNYSNVLGTFAAGGISNAYYPANDRGVGLTMENSLIGLAAGGGAALLQEFLIKKLSRGVPPSGASRP